MEIVPVTNDAVNAPFAGQLHAAFLLLLPRIQTHARVHFRHVKCPGRRDDLAAEAVGVAWKWYARAVGAGKDPADFPGAFAALACRHARCGRTLCGSERAKDALSKRAQRLHNFAVQTVPAVETGVDGNEAIAALRDNTRTPPPEQAAFRIDFPAWLAQLTDRNRRMARDMALGESTTDLAIKHDVSQARVSQLRRELHRSWRLFHGEPVA
jgi:hypothetical protein